MRNTLRFHVLLWGVMLFGITSFVVAQTEPKGLTIEAAGGQKFAFLVAVGEYENFKELHYTVNDVTVFRDQLIESGFSPQNILLIKSGGKLSDHPTKKNITAGFDRMMNRLHEGDLVICMFSGHGVEVNGSRLFCPQEASNESAESLRESCLSMEEIKTKLNESKAKFKWLIVDACRNEATRGNTVGAKSLTNIDSIPAGMAVLESCTSGQFSWEDEKLGHGVFTHSLIEGLKGKATNPEGEVTLFTLCSFAKRMTEKHVLDTFKTEQQPFFELRSSDFILRNDLVKDGIAVEKWNEAEALYQSAIQLRRQRKYEEAKLKIAAARKINPKREIYIEEEKDITDYFERERANQGRAQAAGYASVASGFLEKKEFTKAKTEIEKALKLFPNDVGFKAIKSAIELAEKSSQQSVIPPVTTPVTPSVPASASGWQGKSAGDRKVLTIKGVEYAFRWCPAGKFMMGSPEGELGRSNDETQHQVTLTKGFWLLETEVTQGMWESVMGTSVADQAKNSKIIEGVHCDPRVFGLGAMYPMYNINWKDCQDFIKKLNNLSGVMLSGVKFGLPTEAQWEYACRAGTTTALNNGKNLTSAYGICSNLNEVSWGTQTTPHDIHHEVGSKKPNAWGLYDMHGNVHEWCSDWKTDYPTGSVTDPVGPTTGIYRIYRGGSFGKTASGHRSAFRDSHSPSYRGCAIGLRLSLVSE